MTTVRKTIITIETGAVHFAENTNGAVVCVISLKADGGK
jgi:hypothetical protein